MDILFLILIVLAITFWSRYGIQCGKIRIYIQENDEKLFKDMQLDGFSLMLGPPEIAWNAQKYILGGKYKNHKDPHLVAMCGNAYKSALVGFLSFCAALLTVFANNV